MQVNWQARNMELTDQVREAVQTKLERLAKKLAAITDAEVELTREGTKSRQDQVVTQITVNGKGVVLRAEERAPDVLTGAEAAVRRLENRIEHLKGRLYRSESPRREAAELKQVEEDALLSETGPADEDAGGQVVRVKQFAMKPVTVEEAITQMESLGHQFFFFLDASTNQHAVVYRRDDGNYGVIQPR